MDDCEVSFSPDWFVWSFMSPPLLDVREEWWAAHCSGYKRAVINKSPETHEREKINDVLFPSIHSIFHLPLWLMQNASLTFWGAVLEIWGSPVLFWLFWREYWIMILFVHVNLAIMKGYVLVMPWYLSLFSLFFLFVLWTQSWRTEEWWVNPHVLKFSTLFSLPPSGCFSSFLMANTWRVRAHAGEASTLKPAPSSGANQQEMKQCSRSSRRLRGASPHLR